MQLLLIDKKSVSNGCMVGDVIGVFPDSHKFSNREYDIFRVVYIDLTIEEINAIRPKHSKSIDDAPMQEPPRFDLHYVDGKLTTNG